MTVEKFDLVKAVARKELLTAWIGGRKRVLGDIGTERATVRVDSSKDPSEISDQDFLTIEKIGRVRKRVSQSVSRLETEAAEVDDQITAYAPVYSETLEKRKIQIDRITSLHQEGFVKDTEFNVAVSSYESYAALPERSEALKRGLLAMNTPVDQSNKPLQIESSQEFEQVKEPKRPVGVLDLESKSLVLDGKSHVIRSDSMLRVLELFINHGGSLASELLHEIVTAEKLTDIKHSPATKLVHRIQTKFGHSIIRSEYAPSRKLPTYILEGDFSIQEQVTEESENIVDVKASMAVETPSVVETPILSASVIEADLPPERVSIVVDPNKRNLNVGGVKVTVGSDARWEVFLKIASENGATAAELDQVLLDHGVVSKHLHQGPRTVSSIKEAFKQFGDVIKVKKSDKNERVYSLDADVTFLPVNTPEKPAAMQSEVDPVVEEIKREVDIPFIDNFSKGDIAIIASTCLTNREPIEKILSFKNLSLVETEVLKGLTEIVGDETLLPLTRLPNDQAENLIKQAREQAFSKVVDLLGDDNYEGRLSEIFDQHPDVWQLMVNLSELSDLVCKFGQRGEKDKHPLVQIFSEGSRALLFNMDNKKQVPQEFRFKEGVTLGSIIKRINEHQKK